MANEQSPFPIGEVAGVIAALLVVAAVVALAIHFVLEKNRVAQRKTLERSMLRYSPVAAQRPAQLSIGETIDGSGIPKVRSVDKKVVMLAYGHLLSSPTAEEVRVCQTLSSLPGYIIEIQERPVEEREWYRNVAMTVIMECILSKRGDQVVELIPQVTRAMSGSIGIRDLLVKLVSINQDDSFAELCRLLNDAMINGQPRSRYIVSRALGLLFRDPHPSDPNGPLLEEISSKLANAIDLSALVECLSVNPTVYEIYEQVVQLRAPPEALTPSTPQVIEHLLQSDDGFVYLAFILHVRKVPHSPFVPKELVVQLVLLSRHSALVSAIVDEILATNLKGMAASRVARLENAPFVILLSEIMKTFKDAHKSIPDTLAIANQEVEAIKRYRNLVAEDPLIMDWIEEQQATFRKRIVYK